MLSNGFSATFHKIFNKQATNQNRRNKIKPVINIKKLENEIKKLVEDIDRETFIYDLLRAYCLPKAAITRLKQGAYNQSKKAGEILWKKKLYFKREANDDLHTIIDDMKTGSEAAKHAPRFLVVTDFHAFLAIDTRTDDSLDIAFKDLPNSFDFFLPWAGLEKTKVKGESLAQLYDPDKMPNGLRQAHHEMDLAVERCYRTKPFTSDEERLEYLFKLYEEMTQAEGSK